MRTINILLFYIGTICLFSSCGDPHSSLNYYIRNNSSDTIYVEKPCCDHSETKTITIDDQTYIKIAPKDLELLFQDDKIGWPGERELTNSNFNQNLKLIKGKDTLAFIFSEKDKCSIDIDGQIGSYTRKID